MCIPILLIGSMALVMTTFAQSIQNDIPEGFLIDLVLYASTFIFNATFGMWSLYIVNFISISYMQQCRKNLYLYGAPITSMIGFVIWSGGLRENFSLQSFGTVGLFTAIIVSVVATLLYCKILDVFSAEKFYTAGADLNFNNVVSCLLPMSIVTVFFTCCLFIAEKLFHVSSFQEIFTNILNLIFIGKGRTLGSSLIFVIFTGFLWFYGIHGNNVFANISNDIFAPGVEINMQMIAEGKLPTEIFSGTFINTFVFFGGSGSLLCLLIAVLLFSKRKNNRYLAKVSAVPMLFNVNELFMFGLPVVFNPYLFIPFIITPVVCLLTSALAVYTGLVPVTISPVEWTTPIFISGYLATGSISGSILQLVNVVIGIGIYRPFLKYFDMSQLIIARKKLNALVDILQESEEENKNIELMNQGGSIGNVAKTIATELKKALDNNEIKMYYQLQYNDDGTCVGAEALLRWHHVDYGMVYPPLIIKLADEIGILGKLERYIFKSVMEDIKKFENTYGYGLKFSVNVSVKTLLDESFESFLQIIAENGYIKKSKICIEVTEQMALRFNAEMEKKLYRVHKMGYLLAIDDFSMGSTSLKYLQSNQFDLVKLDGSLVRNLSQNANSKEIISSIVYLAQSLGFEVLAEYVETEEQRIILENIGCKNYQGYLFSKAVPYEELCQILDGEKNNQ